MLVFLKEYWRGFTLISLALEDCSLVYGAVTLGL
jgi:hypothetical protein